MSSYQFRRFTGRRLWKASYWDSTVRGNRNTTAVIRYIILNPVKGGLVSTPGDYPFWGSGTHSREALLAFAASAEGPADQTPASEPETEGGPDL